MLASRIQVGSLPADIQEGGLAHAFLALVVLPLTVFVLSAFSQQLPPEIRGYKVHRDKITVSASADLTVNSDSDAVVKIGEPDVVDVGLAGITFALPAKVKPLGQSGKVDFLTFHDFRVNGIAVTVE